MTFSPFSVVKVFRDFLFHRDGSFLYRNRKLILAALMLWAATIIARENGYLPKKSVKGKHVFITGAGSGLGRSMALKFAELGASLTISDINLEGVQETKELICRKDASASDRVVAFKLDVSNRSMLHEVCQDSLKKLGMVHILINNAGIVQGKKFLEMNEAFVHKSLVINLECHFWLIKEFLPAMKKANEG